MTREQAQVYAKISREDLEKIDKGYAKHYDTLCAFANGEEIEFFSVELNEWYSVEDAVFDYISKYRVKPSDAAKSTERWVPEPRGTYFFVKSSGEISKTFLASFFDYEDQKHIDFGNCFSTCEEAESARERVRAALKGEAQAATEKLVESLDGQLLADTEKEILRTLRDYKYEVIGQSEFAFVNDEERLDTNIGVLVVFPFENNIVDEKFAGALRELSNEKEAAQ